MTETVIPSRVFGKFSGIPRPELRIDLLQRMHASRSLVFQRLLEISHKLGMLLSLLLRIEGDLEQKHRGPSPAVDRTH